MAGSYGPSRQGGALSEGYVGVLTVDDQAVFRRVARDVIDATAGFKSVGEASSGEEAVTIADHEGLGGYFGAHLAKLMPEWMLRGIIVVVALIALVRQFV